MVVMFTLETRIAAALLEEVLERSVQIAKTLLKSHAVGRCEPQMLRVAFQRRKPTRTLNIGKTFLTKFPGVRSRSEEMVIHKATAAESTADLLSLDSVRVYSVLIAFA